jgi:hypothetical protein
MSKDSSSSEKAREILGLKGDSTWQFYVSMTFIFLFFCILVIFCVFLVLTCLRRRREALGQDKEAEAAGYGDDENQSSFRNLRGLLSRDLWSRATKQSEIEIEHAAPTTKNTALLTSGPKYAELPTGEGPSQLHQTNLDDVADIRHMEAYYEDEEDDDQNGQHAKHNLDYPHATKV